MDGVGPIDGLYTVELEVECCLLMFDCLTCEASVDGPVDNTLGAWLPPENGNLEFVRAPVRYTVDVLFCCLVLIEGVC